MGWGAEVDVGRGRGRGGEVRGGCECLHGRCGSFCLAYPLVEHV